MIQSISKARLLLPTPRWDHEASKVSHLCRKEQSTYNVIKATLATLTIALMPPCSTIVHTKHYPEHSRHLLPPEPLLHCSVCLECSSLTVYVVIPSSLLNSLQMINFTIFFWLHQPSSSSPLHIRCDSPQNVNCFQHLLQPSDITIYCFFCLLVLQMRFTGAGAFFQLSEYLAQCLCRVYALYLSMLIMFGGKLIVLGERYNRRTTSKT